MSELTIRCGSGPAGSFRVRVPEMTDRRKAGNGILEARCTSWSRAAVIFGRKGRLSFVELEASDEPGAVRFGGFFVEGGLRVVNRVNNPRLASEAWRAFEAE